MAFQPAVQYAGIYKPANNTMQYPQRSSTPGTIRRNYTEHNFIYTTRNIRSQQSQVKLALTASGTYSVSLISIASDGSFYKINPWTGAVTFNMSSTGYKALSPQLMGGIQGSNSYTGFYKDPYVLSVQTITTAGVSKYYLINWTTAGTTTNFTQRIMGNVSLPFAVPTYPGGILGYNTFVVDPETNRMFWMAGLAPLGVGVYHGTWMMAVDMTTGNIAMEPNISRHDKIQHSLLWCRSWNRYLLDGRRILRWFQ